MHLVDTFSFTPLFGAWRMVNAKWLCQASVKDVL
jgi:hypothetical protein